VIEEGILKYRAARLPTLEPKENVGLKMMEVREAKKAFMLARGSRTNEQDAGCQGSGEGGEGRR
jgi:hypothetical protein